MHRQLSQPEGEQTSLVCFDFSRMQNKTPNYLVDIVMVKNAVKVLVDVIEHVDHFHGRAVVAQCGEAHDVTEIDGDLFKQLWLHFARLFQGAHHWAEGQGTFI